MTPVAETFRAEQIPEWTIQGINTLLEAIEAYMMEVLAKSHF
jgi:hypothetical protein